MASVELKSLHVKYILHGIPILHGKGRVTTQVRISRLIIAILRIIKRKVIIPYDKA